MNFNQFLTFAIVHLTKTDHKFMFITICDSDKLTLFPNIFILIIEGIIESKVSLITKVLLTYTTICWTSTGDHLEDISNDYYVAYVTADKGQIYVRKAFPILQFNLKINLSKTEDTEKCLY